MNVNMLYKHLTDDEFNYSEDNFKKYEFLFQASNGEEGYLKRFVEISLQLYVSLSTGDNSDEFSVEIYEPIISGLIPGATTNACCTMKNE